MATNEQLIPIPGRLHSLAPEGHVAGADEIYDDDLQKSQSEVNALVREMGASGENHSKGLVPDPGATQGTSKYLREDGTWAQPDGQNYTAGDGIDITSNAISVKVGTNLSIDSSGNLNATDTTYSVMGASGSTHSGGLVPDTPSTAGTTKFLREDGTWQEPAGQNYSAGDGIDISNNEISADNTIARKTDLAPAKLGSGIGTCSTSSGTALEVVLSDYNLVQNGIVAVTFENDVPANATLNINSKGAKPIYYKDSAIEADTIKADDTVMFAYDGTNYVVTSLGGGGSEVQVNEVAVISLVSDVAAHQSDLIGATIVVTDDDTSETLLSTTWQGTPIEVNIPVPTDYTITVSPVNMFTTPAAQSYSSKTTRTRNVTFEYIYNPNVVDMGLPSGVLWARKNIDVTQSDGFAASEYQYECSFFSWGNVVGHNPISNSAFSYDFGTSNSGPYAQTPGSQLSGDVPTNPTYDIARAVCGEPWRLPTSTEFQELINNCDFVQADGETVVSGTDKRVTVNGIVGIYLKSKINGNRLFFPCCGYGEGTPWRGSANSGHYWSSSLASDTTKGKLLIFYSEVLPQHSDVRYDGFVGRAVM